MRIFWILVDRFGPLLFILGLGAPFLLTAFGARIERRRGKQGGVRHFGALSCGGCAVGTILGLSLLYLSMCSPPSGSGAEAESWYERTAPVISALDRYHAERGAYPESLQELVPRYLTATALSVLEFGPNLGLEYRPENTDYRLEFHYSGPGMNTCKYDLRSKRWNCHGYY
jgi:hypothetical protein